MFYRITDDLARRTIEVLRRYWAGHPRYPDLQVQGKYSFEERPQRGIVVKVGGANHQAVSADNFQGVVLSRTHLTTHPNHPGRFVDWVREDDHAVLANKGLMPSPPGIYWINAVRQEDRMVAYVDALLDREREVLKRTGPSLYRFASPPVPGSTRLWVEPGYPLATPEDYELVLDAGRPTGEVRVKSSLLPGAVLRADYRYYAGERPPFELREKQANWQAIPGVVVCVGTRIEPGDVVGVVVEPVRRPAALEYSGRWEVSLDIDVFARDVHDQRELADATAMHLMAVVRSWWSDEGIEILSVGINGEGEETYDENGDDYFYTANLGMTCLTEWYAHFPLDLTIRELVGPYASDVSEPGSPVELFNPSTLRDPYFFQKSSEGLR